MSEGENIEQEPKGDDTPEDVNEYASQEKAIEQLQSQSENMEVQKHPHRVTHKKKWGEYLLEFFMLFLAVLLGFIAENIRENPIEHERAKEYANLLIEDLSTDTTQLNTAAHVMNLIIMAG